MSLEIFNGQEFLILFMGFSGNTIEIGAEYLVGLTLMTLSGHFLSLT